MPSSPRGFTFIEVLIAIGILGLLMAILIPAVQSSRAAARRTQCKNQLRQIALATQNYSDLFERMPNGAWARQLRGALGVDPEAEVVSLYACPTDSEHADGTLLNCRVSYALNAWLRHPEPLEGGMVLYMVSTNRVTDGLSNTVGYSERLSLPWFAPQVIDWNDHPHLWLRGMRRLDEAHHKFSEFREACQHRSGKPRTSWYLTKEYDHVMPPNHNSCRVIVSSPLGVKTIPQAVTASSMHPGGVHSALLDGSVRFVSSSIDARVWYAIGTPDGGEINVAF